MFDLCLISKFVLGLRGRNISWSEGEFSICIFALTHKFRFCEERQKVGECKCQCFAIDSPGVPKTLMLYTGT